MAEQQFVIRLGVNSSNVEKGINAAVAQVNRLTRAAAGFFTLGYIGNLFRQIIDEGGKIQDVANRFGTTAEFVQKIGYAAKKSGVEMEGLEGGFRNLQKAQIEALEGSADTAAAFGRIGISLAELKSLTPENLFMRVSEQLGKMAPSARVTTDAMTLLGKTGTQLLGAFRDGFTEAAGEAEKLGQVMKEDVVAKLDEAGDRVEAFGKKWRGAMATGVSKLLEGADVLGDFITQSVGFVATVGYSLAAGNGFAESMQGAAEVVKEMAQESADLASHKDNKNNPAPRDASDVKSKEEKKKLKEFKEDKTAPVDVVDSAARRGVFVGGRDGEITRVPVQTLEETRMMRRHVETLVELQKESIRTANPMLTELRKLYAKLTEEA